MEKITVRAPATVANVVCGFDCLGFAIKEPFDEITISIIEEQTVKIKHLDNFNLPTEADQNVAGKAVLAMIEKIQSSDHKKPLSPPKNLEHIGFQIEIKKGIKPGSGIGSSAASAVGAVVAANELLGNHFRTNELLEFALAGEELASQGRHADNIAPCLLGGFTLVRSVDPLDIVKLEFPPLFVTVIHPQIEIKTSEARKILPQQIPLKTAVKAWSNLGAFVSALSKGDYELLARSMEDEIIEPVRKGLIPYFDELKKAGLKAGALGGGISGSGPSVFMLSKSQEIAQNVAQEMSGILDKNRIPFKAYVSEIDSEGTKVIPRRKA
ncbi:MAG: homoserine kinase [Acidobacteria bacterium]|jgi:homoserine kinase|nr:MAG: homoserine kinase [Acidobacteriota bacterium]GIU82999.1 MAG: homoserine kinase [Pyrinomonadaceae bacterium]